MFKSGFTACLATLLLGFWPVRTFGGVSQLTNDLPSIIQPTGNTLGYVLERFSHAQGHLAPGHADTMLEHETIVRDSVSGTITRIASGKNQRVDETLGLLATAYGTSDGRDWQMNADGEVVVDQGIHKRDAIDQKALHAAVASHGASQDVKLLGRISQPIDAYVIEIDPPNGVLEYLYVDASTWYLDASVLRYPDHSVRYTFGDYRTVDGIATPWHTHEWINDQHKDESLVSPEIDMRVTDLARGISIDPARLAIPRSTSIGTVSGPPVRLPARIIDDRVILKLQVGGRSVNLQLDSGAAGIFLDDGILRALGYTITLQSSVVPSMSLGSLTMQNVHVHAVPFANMADSNTPVAGLIGFDFIDSVVVHVDYADGMVWAIDPQTFTPPAGAISLPIALDDSIPAFTASVGGVPNLRFLLDTGADNSMLFSTFAKAHPEALRESAVGAELQASYPFLESFMAVGGPVQFQSVEVGPLDVGTLSFADWPFSVTQDPRVFDLLDYDGLLGQDFLRYFDLYLDYQHDRVLLVPNARYTERFAT